MKWFGATDTGRRRGNNEDAFLVDPSLHAAILADGMGGENCGEVGSAITVATIAEYLRRPEDDLSPEELAKEAIRAANRRVIETARQRHECDGMGSTVVLVLWCPSRLVIANGRYKTQAGPVLAVVPAETSVKPFSYTLTSDVENVVLRINEDGNNYADNPGSVTYKLKITH